MGLPGAGKSTIAEALSSRLGLRVVCRDTIRHAMFPQCDYSFIEKRAAFRAVLLAVEINGLLGASSVIDGMTFARREDFERLCELAQQHRFELLPLLADCTPAIARKRIADDRAFKTHLARDRVPELVDAVVGRFEALPDGIVRIDTSASEADMCAAAVAIVAQRLQLRA
jgi:predicted kinase